MGKGQRARLARADEVKEKKIAAKKKERRDKIVRIISVVTSLVLVVGLLGWIGYSIVDSANRDNGVYLNRDVAVESANYKVTNGQMMYYFQNYVSNFINSNADYLQAIGLDTSKSLKAQNYPSNSEDGSTQTWYEYLMEQAVAQVQQTLVFAEAAKADGIELDEHAKSEMDATLEQIDPANYAPGLTKEAIGEFINVSMLASEYQTKMQEEITCTKADMEKYYKEHKNNYDKVDYRMYSFSYAVAEEEGETAMTKEAAKELADKLAATGKEDAYVAWLTDYFTNTLKVKDVATELNATKTTGFDYTESYVGADFLFDSATKAGQIKVVEDESSECYKVFMLLKPAYRDTTITKTVRHILTSVAEDADAAAKAEAKKKAEDLLAQWKKNGGTEDAFAALVHDNTDDTGSKETGGLIENFSTGQMVEAFEKWSFDAARKTGDTGVVETEYGYHTMYFVGNGLPAWENAVKTDYTNEKYTEQSAALAEKNVVTVNDKTVAKIASYIA